MSEINLATLSQNLNIATVEQIHVYSGMLLNRLNPDLRVLETANQAQFSAQFNIFQIADGTQRVMIRTSIEIDPNWNSDRSKKLWMWTKELSNTQIPPSFLSN